MRREGSASSQQHVNKTASPPSRPKQDVPQTVEHLFRHEAAKMVATLTGIFGVERLTLAEDVVQEAMARALQTWPYYGVPENPAAWLMRTARNRALDAVRREKTFREKEPEITRLIEEFEPSAPSISDQEISDDRLRMMFVCCHPQIQPEAQVALALRLLCGFGISEIARAFLTSDAAIAKRLTRAKQRIIEAKVPFEIPVGPDLEARLDGVLQSLYLLFNEGYKASGGDALVREDICAEAIRLATLLAEHPAGNQPKTHALLALMLLNFARTPARVDEAGNLLRLQEQDRTKWDRAMIAQGIFHLSQSAAGAELTEYHLQAGIAACHCAARDFAATDWQRILALYDNLIEFDASPIVALNRAVALAQVEGPLAGIEVIQGIQDQASLEGYYLFHAVWGELDLQINRPAEAAAHFHRALELANTKSERAFLKKRLQACAARPVEIA